MRLQIDVKGINEALAGLRNTPKNIGERMRQAFTESAAAIEADAKENAPVDTGRLRSSITHRVTYREAEYVAAEIGSKVEYAPYVELGTRPHYPPLEALITWVHHKGLGATGNRHQRTLQYALDTIVARRIQQAIGRRGTKAQPYLEPAFVNQADAVVRSIAAAVQAGIQQAST